MLYLFIFSLPNICYVMGRFHKCISYKPEQYWCEVASRFCQTERQHRKLHLPLVLTLVHVHSDLSRYSIMISHIPLFPFFPSCGFSFSTLLSPSISTSAKFDITFSSPPSTAMGWLAEHPLNSACKLSRIPPFWVLILDVCLSVSVSEKQVALSVNKCLIFRLLVPVCLSVCLTCRQLSRRSRVAVSQVLVSVLLSVHLPVKASQIRHVNLPPGFPLLQDGFIKNK